MESLKPHADGLAAALVVFSEPSLLPLLTPRVLENGRVLLDSYQIIARAISQDTLADMVGQHTLPRRFLHEYVPQIGLH